MEQDSPGRSTRLRDDEDFSVHGARNVNKMEKLESKRTHTTSSRSTTDNGHQGTTHYSVPYSSSPEILIDDSVERRTSATADESDEWRSRKTEQRPHSLEQHSDTQVKRYGTAERRAAADVQRSDTEEQTHSSTRSLSRRQRNIAAAEMAYRTVGLPDDTQYSRVSKRVDKRSRSKPRGGLRGLEGTADLIVEDAMEQAIEIMYGNKRRRKAVRDVRTSSTGETRSLDRVTRATTADSQAYYNYDTTQSENKAFGRTTNETTSTDKSRKKAVSYLRVEKDDEDEVDVDVDLHRPASADGRLTNRVDYRRAQVARRLPVHVVPLRSCYEATSVSPSTSRYQLRTATNLLASQRVGGYSSETELMQSSAGRDRRQPPYGDDSDFSTTVEVRSPRTTQFQTENGGYTSDDSDTRNLQHAPSQSRVPTLTKGMVTKILYGERPRAPSTDAFVSEVRKLDVQSTTPPVQFRASPSSAIKVLASPTVYHDSQLSTVVPVGTVADSPLTLRPSAVDDNFLLQRAPAYQPPLDDARHRGGGTGRSTPASLQTMVENDERPLSSYAAFSNEPIIVTSLDDNYITTMSKERSQSLFALDKLCPGSPRSQTPIYSSRPDIRMNNRQVLNLYLFNRRPDREGVEMETVTRVMTFDDEVQNKQTQTPLPVHRETTHYITRQRDVEKLAPPQTSKCIQTDKQHIPPKPSTRRKPAPSCVTEETVIMKQPSITETRETEMVGDVFADRRRTSSQEPEPLIIPATRSSVSHAGEESAEQEQEEEMVETTVVEEKEQRIEMTIREDLEFSLQRSKGTSEAAAGSAVGGKVEPWWIPDKFEAFVERKQQKVTQTRDMENKDEYSKRVDIDSQDTSNPSDNFENSSNHELNVNSQNASRHKRGADRNTRIPIFLESHYNSPMHGMTSPSSNLVRAKMATHSEPELNRRHQYYMSKRDKYYGSLFDDSRHKPLKTPDKINDSLLVRSSRQHVSSADVTALRMEEVDDKRSGEDNSPATEKRYVSAYSQYISPPLKPDGDISHSGNSDSIMTDIRASCQPVSSGKGVTAFPTPKIITLPYVGQDGGDGGANDHDGDHFPESLDHFDRVLTEIEDELPPPPPPPPVPPPVPSDSRRLQDTAVQHQYHITKSSVTPFAGARPKKSKPLPPEKSWKRRERLPPTSGKLYSSQDRPVNTTASGHENQGRTTSLRSAGQSASLKATADKEKANLQHAKGSDFHRELGDRSYISLSLTEPVQREEQRRRIAVVAGGQRAGPGGFTYGWTSHEHKKRKHSPPPGRYQLRHSRTALQDFETAVTAF